MIVVRLSPISKADRYGLFSAYYIFSAGSKGTLRPSIREKNVKVLRHHIKSAPSTTNATKYVFKHFSIHRNFDRGSPNAPLLWSGSNRQLLSYLTDQVIDGFFYSWNRRRDSVNLKAENTYSCTNKFNS